MASLLQFDPSRTTTLRRQFESEVKRRYNRLLNKIIDLLVDEDALGLKPENRIGSTFPLNQQRISGILNSEMSNVGLYDFSGRLTTNAGRWRFLTSSQKLTAFQDWLALQMKQEILTDERTTSDDWWRKYVDEGYRKGAGRAFDDVRGVEKLRSGRESPEFYRGTRDEFLRSSFGRAETIEKTQLLASRVFTDLKGVTEAVSTQLTRHLVDGMTQGRNPRDIARDMAKAIDGIGKNRSLTIARTEIIRAHAEGQLDAMERLGVKEVGVMVEWATARDDRVCQLCLPLEGVVMSIKEARGTIPRHPNCRCIWTPANVGESKKDQHRTKTQVKTAMDKSIQAENPNKPLSTVKEKTRWAGADTKIAKKRPQSILNKE